jgi:hypothetical protein
MEVSGHLQPLTDLPPRESSLHHSKKWEGGLATQPGYMFWITENLIPLAVIELRFLDCPARDSVVIPATIFLLLFLTTELLTF